MNKPPLQVSDWSQPYKLVLYSMGLLYFIGWSLYVVYLLKAILHQLST